jgi:FixJ family two-component response regulator
MTKSPGLPIIAVVDDDPGVLRSLEFLLDSADYDPRLFTSAAELLDSGCLTEIDCLVTDIDMPGLDGFELVRRVESARPGLPTIVISGYPDTLKRVPQFPGAQPRLFTKPFQGPELLAAIGSSLSSRLG